MLRKFQAFLNFKNKKEYKAADIKLNKVVDKYSFFFIRKDIEVDRDLDLTIIQNITKSDVIIIDYYKDESNDFHFIIGFKKTILIIQQSILSNLKPLFLKRECLNICFLKDTKSIFDQNININYNESEKNELFEEEISEIYKNFLNTKSTEFLFKDLLHHIKLNISGYLIQQSYYDANSNRIKKFYSKSKKEIIPHEMNQDEFIELRENIIESSFKSTLFYHIEYKKLVIIKRPNSYDNENIKLLKQEINNYSKINHQYIPKFYGTVDFNNIKCPVFEYINGDTILNTDFSNFSISDKISIIFQLLLVFNYLHMNEFIYRDLKPSNVIIDQNKIAVVINFDKMINKKSDINNNDSQTVISSSEFAAPEINFKNITYKCDIFSFGKIINEILPEIQNDHHFSMLYKSLFNENPKMRPNTSHLINSLLIFIENKNITLNNIDVNSQLKIAFFYLGRNNFKKAIQYSSLAVKQIYLEENLNSEKSDNVHKVIHYFTLAAEQNYSEAQFILGLIYDNNIYVSRDVNKSIHYFTLAANQNHPGAQFMLGLIYDKNVYVSRNINKSIHYFTLAANQNHPDAQFILGVIYNKGEYISMDIDKAIHYYKLAAKHNHPGAQYNLGSIYNGNKYVSRNLNKAIHYYSLAAKNNHPDAEFNLGLIYDEMNNINKAIHFFSRAAEHNHPEAQFIFGFNYYYGNHIAQDINKSIHYYSLAANQNHPKAQFNLGSIYLDGKYVSCDINKAIHYFSLAADQNHRDAQFNLGVIYYNKKYVARDIKKSIYYFSLAANNNHSEAQYNLGVIFFKCEDIAHDIDKAIHYFSLAAHQNHPAAQFLLGYIYANRKYSFNDINKAIHYFSLAEKQNDPCVKYNLGVIYFDGDFISRDINKAIHFLTLAANQNHQDAQFILGYIYYEGKYITRDINKALHYFKLAEKQNNNNNSHVQFTLGQIYFNGKYITRDVNKAIHYFTLASNQNHQDAQFTLGQIYFNGKYITRDINKAIHYFTLAANKNHSDAQFNLGYIYYLGIFVQQNINKGIYWITRSSENNNTQAKFSLGFLYHEGKNMKRDITKSVIFYKEASSFNNEFAKNNLGILYKHGFKDIITKNPEKAKIYFEEAIKQKEDKVSMYNLAHIYIYEDSSEKSINESIDLLIKSSIQNFEPSIKLLCLVLIKKYGENINNVLNEIHDFSKSAKNLVSLISEKINKILDNQEMIDEKFQYFKNIDFIYNIESKPIVSCEIFNEKINKKFEDNQMDVINSNFYKGFEL